MAVGLSIRFERGSSEDYDKVDNAIGTEENPPDGLLVHSAGPVHDGWGVIDFWESRGHFDRFAEERLQPAIQEAGVDLGPPEIKEFPVHHLVVPK